MTFNDQSPIGQYDITFQYLNSYTFTNVAVPFSVEWNLTFSSPQFTKNGSSLSHLMNITFSSDLPLENLNTIINPSIITNIDGDDDSYETLLINTNRKINLSPPFDIDYVDYYFQNTYYIIGQVANTDLTYYSPVFYIPDGAEIFRMNSIDGEVKENSLYTDFTPLDENEFHYIKYRIYAEDYDFFPDHFTDYYIAVLDVTNNVYLNVNVHMLADIPLSSVFSTFLLTKIDGSVSQISLYTFFEELTEIGIDYALKSTTSGIFIVSIDLPKGYTFYIKVDQVEKANAQFEIPASLLSIIYTIDIYIEDTEAVPAWGQRWIEFFLP